jgi:hypothetical protein
MSMQHPASGGMHSISQIHVAYRFSNKKDQRKSNGLKVFLVPLLLTPAELAVGLGSEVNPILPAKGGEEKFAPKNGSSVPPAKGGGIRRFIGDEYISKLFVVK